MEEEEEESSLVRTAFTLIVVTPSGKGGQGRSQTSPRRRENPDKIGLRTFTDIL